MNTQRSNILVSKLAKPDKNSFRVKRNDPIKAENKREKSALARYSSQKAELVFKTT